MNEGNIQVRTGPRQRLGGLRVDAERGLDIGFGLVHRGVGGGVDHGGRRQFADPRRQCRGVGQVGGNAGHRRRAIQRIQATVATGGDHLAQARQAAAQFAPDLAVATDHQQPGHGV